MFDRVLAAIDGSEYSHRALECAVDLASKYNSSLILVHAYPHTSDLLGYEDFHKLVSQRKSAGQKILDDTHPLIEGKGVESAEELLEGPETEAILKVAKVEKADIIVMGTRGLGTLKGMVLGSVSRKVLHYAQCTVMVVR